MKYCLQCGSARVVQRVPDGDNRERASCIACGYIHYVNPKMVVGCIPEWQGRILLCRRAIEPARGYWTVPAGFMETGETLEQAAARETQEEACAQVEIEDLLAVVNVLDAQQVHFTFRARMLQPEYAPGIESLETGLFTQAAIPWTQIAFPSVRYSLECYYADRAAGLRRLHMGNTPHSG